MENGVTVVLEKGELLLKMPNGDTIPGVTKLTIKNDAEDGRHTFATVEILLSID